MTSLRDRLVPSALRLPLRDALRGVRKASELSDDLLKPVREALPEPVRDFLRDALQTAEAAGQRVVSSPNPTADEMAETVAALQGHVGETGTTARVIAFGLETALAARQSRLLVSETVAALAVRGAFDNLPDNTTPAARAVAAYRALSADHVAGRMPGTGIALGQSDEVDIDAALLTVMLWLLAERPADPDEEQAIVGIAAGLLTATLENEDLRTLDDEALADRLDELAGLI